MGGGGGGSGSGHGDPAHAHRACFHPFHLQVQRRPTAAASDQKNKKKKKNKKSNTSQYTAVYCSILWYTAVYWTLRAFLHHIVFITRRAHKLHADTLSQAKPHDLRAGDVWLCALPGSNSWCRGLGPPQPTRLVSERLAPPVIDLTLLTYRHISSW